MQPILQTVLVLAPSHAVHAGGRVPLQGVVAFPQQVDRQMVQQSREPFLLPFPRHSGAPRLIPGTRVPRSVSDACWTRRCSPWFAPFPPPPPPRLAPPCSAASSVLWRRPTPLAAYMSGLWLLRLPGPVPICAGTPQRSPGSRAYCFAACLGSSTTPGPACDSRLTPPADVAFPRTGVH